MSVAIAEVFADAAQSYQSRIGGDTVNGRSMELSRHALIRFYEMKQEKLIELLRSRPLEEICKANNIGREGQKILEKEIQKLVEREKNRQPLSLSRRDGGIDR